MTPECCNINPYDDDPRDKTSQVSDMFDAIAPRYDFMNHAMTLGIDKIWRRRAISALRKIAPHPRYILDIATGTADLAISLAQRLDPVSVVGIDISEEMLLKGAAKVANENLSTIITLQQADSLQIPFPDKSFDCITVAFGVRNFEDLSAGYAEMFRVLRPGGTLMVIELSTPTSSAVRPMYNFYTQRLVPTLGRLFTKDRKAYSYLPASISAVPQGQEMLDLIKEAGFTDTSFRTYSFGTCSVYFASKSTNHLQDSTQ